MMELAFDCSNCKQFSQYKKCVHTLLLEKDAHDYLLFSESCGWRIEQRGSG